MLCCPNCGRQNDQGSAFQVGDTCPHCGLEISAREVERAETNSELPVHGTHCPECGHPNDDDQIFKAGDVCGTCQYEFK